MEKLSFIVRIILMLLIIYCGIDDIRHLNYFIGTTELIIGILLLIAFIFHKQK